MVKLIIEEDFVVHLVLLYIESDRSSSILMPSIVETPQKSW